VVGQRIKYHKRGFKFENIWALHEGCTDIIKNAWYRVEDQNNTLPIKKKLSVCANILGSWKLSEFGHVHSKIQDSRVSRKSCNGTNYSQESAYVPKGRKALALML